MSYMVKTGKWSLKSFISNPLWTIFWTSFVTILSINVAHKLVILLGCVIKGKRDLVVHLKNLRKSILKSPIIKFFCGYSAYQVVVQICPEKHLQYFGSLSSVNASSNCVCVFSHKKKLSCFPKWIARGNFLTRS